MVGQRASHHFCIFFELMYIGDMVQSMMRVFFEKQMVRVCIFVSHFVRVGHSLSNPNTKCALIVRQIGSIRTYKGGFSNVVMREIKLLKNTLSDWVVSGMSSGTHISMNQVCLTSTLIPASTNMIPCTATGWPGLPKMHCSI